MIIYMGNGCLHGCMAYDVSGGDTFYVVFSHRMFWLKSGIELTFPRRAQNVTHKSPVYV